MCRGNRTIQIHLPVLAVAMFSVILSCYPSSLFASDDTHEICQTKITSLEPEYLQTKILNPVHFKYEISIDKKCQFRIVPAAQMPMVCNKSTQEMMESPDSQKQLARIETVCQFRRPGTFFIPPIQFEVSTHQGEHRSYIFPEIQRVDIAPIYPKEDTPFDRLTKLQPWTPELNTFWLILFGTLILALGTAVGFAAYKAAKQKKTVEEERIPPRPIEIFLAQIAPLAEFTPTTIEEYKTYYDRLSYALRVYLSQKFKLDAMSNTTFNLKKLLLDHGIAERLCDEIKHILSESDMVKFAQEMPSQAANLLLLKNTNLVATRIEEEFPDFNDPTVPPQSPAPKKAPMTTNPTA